ncbi:serine hydroxymethyltransferase [Pelagibacteraceae bacterium]|nr:serine hydroxymethyltransferase [Pelagibacteraceae bacterium]
MESESVTHKDDELDIVLQKELYRQQNTIELIASENFTSEAVMKYQGSVLTNKYAEGYPGKRYYGGCEFVDIAENLAIDRLKKLFNCKWANVQPNSGSQANQAVFLALLSPGDTILGMSLSAGGHLTHGAKPNQSGKYFNSIQYGVKKENGQIDYEELRDLAKKNKPKLIIAGASAYSSKINFKIFREVADEVGAYLLVDMAHYSGLIASRIYPDPLPYADICTSTTHKTLRGPRGGIILSNNEEIGKLVDKAVFPGLQGGPLMHVIAAKAAAFKEALSNDFKSYSLQTLKNAKALCSALKEKGFEIVSGETDCHMLLVDLTNKGVTGKLVENTLDEAGITCNKNSVPFDEKSPFITSGIRLGTAAGTTRGFKEKEFIFIGELISDVIYSLKEENKDLEQTIKRIRVKVSELCQKFPLY